MSDLLTQFERLLEAGKLAEAEDMLEALVRRTLTPKEEAEAKVLQARMSIKLENAIYQAYIDMLDGSIAEVKELNAKGRAFEEKVKLAKTRAILVE